VAGAGFLLPISGTHFFGCGASVCGSGCLAFAFGSLFGILTHFGAFGVGGVGSTGFSGSVFVGSGGTSLFILDLMVFKRASS
jgi:hypothetical protein